MACAIPANEIVEALATSRWWSRRRVVAAPLVSRLLESIVAHERRGLRAAAVGRGDGRLHDSAIRGDRIRWLDGSDGAERELLTELEALRVCLNRLGYFGIDALEAHFACYPTGAFYRRHVDTFRDSDVRVLSFVLYLNDEWRVSDRGELVLYSPDGVAEMARIAPHAGTLVVFESATVPHEVLPATRPRRSVTGWFRRRS